MAEKFDFNALPDNAYPVKKFGSLMPTKNEPFPDFRIYDFMVLGPFVLETDGAFETEYFYEREKVLDCDYLLSSGGETASLPYLGKTVKNDYYGAPQLKWKPGLKKWNALRFDDEESACDDALFQTEQRNCVFYAATYISCDEPCNAVICHESSGCKLFVNGELADNRPYGRVKGLWGDGKTVSVSFKKGLNLLMFKLRTGYIADTIDLTISNCSIYPVCASTDGFGVTYPQPTAVFYGPKEAPRELFTCFTWAGKDSDNAELVYSCGEYSARESFENLKKGESRRVKMTLPSFEKKTTLDVVCEVCNGESRASGKFFAETLPICDFDGTDYRFSDFHFDTTYHQEQRAYAIGAMHITKCIVEKLIDDPDFKAVLSEVDYLHPYYSIYPEHRRTLKDAFVSGRAEADCFFNQPNELTSSGEGFARNMVYGQLYHRDVLGRIAPIYAPGDVFGHPNQMTQICLKGGCHSVQWSKYVLGLDHVFRHVSPDGTVGLHNKCIDRNTAHRLGLKHCSGGAELKSTVLAYPSDGETGWMKETYNKAHYAVFSEMNDGMAQDIARADENNIRNVDIVSRDLTQHHSGVLLTRTDFKQANRLAENLLITAEKLSAIAAYYGAEYPDLALDKAWRQVLCAQHHDSITGTNNEISFIDLMIEYREAITLAQEIIEKALSFIASGVDTDDGRKAYIIFNPHFFERTDVCKITLPDGFAGGIMTDCDGKKYVLSPDEGNTAVFTASVPAFGYKTFYLECSEADKIMSGCDTMIENSYYKITVDPEKGGGVVSLYDKRAKKEVVLKGNDGPANRIAVLREIHDRMETQHEIYTTGQKMFSADYPAEVKSEKCGAYQKLIVTVKLDTVARVRQEITLSKNVKRVDFKTVVEDYQSEDDLFAVTFPIDVKGAGVLFDDRFAPHVWSKSQKKLSFQTHQYASFSHSKIAPTNMFIELGRTTGLRFENGKRLLGDINIGMTAIVRNPSLFAETDILLKALSKKAIPVTPYSDTYQYGTGKLVHFNEDLDNTDTRFVLSVDGVENEYERKLLDAATIASKRKFAAALAKNGFAALYCVDNDNIYKKPIAVVLIKALSAGRLSSELEKISAELSENSYMTLRDAALSDEPGLAENYGAALINRGNIACSVEPDNLLCMMLFHTAAFYGNSGRVTGGKELVPEQKTHSFSYSLYPHSGDYREAEVYKAAQSFNDQFIFCEKRSSGNGVLPQKMSFGKVSDGFAVTLFKAGGSPLASLKRKLPKISERGFALRGFEYNGKSEKVKISLAFDIERVFRTDMLEENGAEIGNGKNRFLFDCPTHSIETFSLIPSAPTASIGNAVLGAQAECVQPVFLRSWEHDLGSVAMGNLGVACSISRKAKKLSPTEYLFTVAAVNNYTDSAISGTMQLFVPDGFSANASSFDYSLNAGEAAEYTVTVRKPDAQAAGVMRLKYEHDGQNFEDIYEFGYFNPEISMTLDCDKIVAKIKNNTGETLEGELLIASPFETWRLGGMNSDSRLSIEPRCQKAVLPPNSVTEYEFTIGELSHDGLQNSFWAACKLCVNGRIHFGFVQKKGARHNVWAHELIDILHGRDKGSIKELLEM